MTTSQERTVNDIRQYILEYDCFRNSPEYEIKRFTIERMNYGNIICVETETGRVGDENTMASIFCRTKRHILIGPRGGVRARGKNPVSGEWKRYRGWNDTMIFGTF